MKKNILILTSDPDSINYEIIEKSLFFFKKKTKNNYIFIGHQNKIFNNCLKKKEVNFINIKKKNNTKTYLKNCFNAAFELLLKKKADGLINLPLNKKNLPKKYFGFTEYISDYFNKKGMTTMLMYSDNFSVCPITTHIPIKKVHLHLNKWSVLRNIKNINNFYQKFIGLKKPKIALMGFNPHNGMDFSYQTEEKRIIIPAIKYSRKKGINVLGPLSPDYAFNAILPKKINALVGSYHDQVLPTFKYINNYKGINITLGLPFIRVSVDHGTGKDIKNKNKANPESFLYALNFFEKNFKKI